jgi:hypothetical protein
MLAWNRHLSLTAWVGTASFSVAVVAMAIDHLVGTEGDDSDLLADPLTFAISLALSGAAAFVLFGWVIPRATSRGPRRAATTGLVCAVVSVIPGIAVLWLGVPFVTAGTGVALGLVSWRSEPGWQAAAAVAAGLAVICLGMALYVYALIA